MSFLPKEIINHRLRELFINPDPDNLQPASYDLRLGQEIYLTREALPKKLKKSEDTFKISPGEFALLTTYETVLVPKDLIAFISMKFKYTGLGLINISGFHVDPGYRGKIIFSVYNAGPNEIVLRYKDPMFIIFFARVRPSVLEEDLYAGEHRKMEGLTAEQITNLRGGVSESFQGLVKRVSDLETRVKIYTSIAGALLISIFILLMKLAFQNVPGP